MQTKTDNKHLATFSCWSAFVEAVEAKSDWYYRRTSWMGGSEQDAYRLARYGWHDQTPKVSAMAQKVADRVVEKTAVGITTEVVYDVTGAAYDPGAYMAGVPECWLAFKPVEEKAGIRIVIDGSISAGVSHKQKITFGTAMTALILALDSAGHPVTVDLFWGGKGMSYRGGDVETFIRLQDGKLGAPLDIDRLTYAIAHPLAFRGLGLSWWGHGNFYPHRNNQKPAETHGPYDLWLGGGHLHDVAKWKDDGEDWVMQQYLAQTEA